MAQLAGFGKVLLGVDVDKRMEPGVDPAHFFFGNGLHPDAVEESLDLQFSPAQLPFYMSQALFGVNRA